LHTITVLAVISVLSARRENLEKIERRLEKNRKAPLLLLDFKNVFGFINYTRLYFIFFKVNYKEMM